MQHRFHQSFNKPVKQQRSNLETTHETSRFRSEYNTNPVGKDMVSWQSDYLQDGQCR